MIARIMVGPILLLLLSISGYSQMVSFPASTSTLNAALSNIEKQTGIGNTFHGGNNRLDSLVHSLPRRPTPLATVLHGMLDPLLLTFSINNDLQMIVIQPDSAHSIHPVKAPASLLMVTGIVTDESGNVLANASIRLKGGSLKGTQSDGKGDFQLRNIPEGTVLVVSYSGMIPVEKKAASSSPLRIQLKPIVMDTVGVTNGYQHISKQNATAAIDVIGQKQNERRIVNDVWGLMENAFSGVLLPHGGQTANGTSITDRIQIRGRSTFLADPDPLIVLNNFPYDGDINNINPNEIESITVLKDAAAASIWGARAGNGVIVIVLKNGRSGHPQLVYHSAVGIQARPDFSTIHSIGSGDFLDFEQQLYKAGYYSSINDPQNYTPVPPGVLILDNENKGLLSAPAADAQRAALRKLNVYDDISRYLYRTSVNQQHSLQFSASVDSNHYYFSADYDNNVPSLTGTQYDRLNLRSQNSFQVTQRLQIEAGINFSETNNQNGGNIQYAYQSPLQNHRIYPYAQLEDAKGQALPLYLDYNSNYLQQTQAAGFPDWSFKPLNELAAEVNKVRNRDYLLTSAIRYRIGKLWVLEARYQFEDELITGKDLHSDSSYFTRCLRNSVIQVDPVTHALSYPIPFGGILDVNSREVVSHQGRLQLNFAREWKIHGLQAIAGYEIKSLETTGNTDRYYGYDPGRSAVNPILDYTGTYDQYLTYTPHNIPNPQAVIQLADHFISYYGNASYSFRHRYHLYGSVRFDEANLFGVATNEKGVPLWSGGLSWQADQEEWYPLREWLPFLTGRVTYGYSGNVARLASAYTTAKSFAGGISGSPYAMLAIQSPPNDRLRWERVGQLNFGIDFASRHNIVSGTLEYYQKHARDLLAQTTADPTLGLVLNPGIPGTYYGNTGGLNGHGVDLKLEVHNLSGPSFAWTTNWLLSYSASRVTQYLDSVGLGNLYRDQTAVNPVIGKPLFSVYSFKATALNAATGAFQGVYQGHTSGDYNLIYNNTPLSDMQYSGPAQPVYFGSMRNSFSMGNLSLSFLLSFQAGHYYRQPGTSQSDLATNWKGFSDYARRWQQAGDEKKTNVPAFQYPFDEVRDGVYTYSSSLVKKSDEIRWDELTIGYDLDKKRQQRLPFEHVRLYGTIMGMGLLWAANKEHTDPYYIGVPRDRARYSLGITIRLLPFTPAK